MRPAGVVHFPQAARQRSPVVDLAKPQGDQETRSGSGFQGHPPNPGVLEWSEVSSRPQEGSLLWTDVASAYLGPVAWLPACPILPESPPLLRLFVD